MFTNIFKSSVTVLIAGLSFNAQAQVPNAKVDFNTVNQVIEEVISKSLHADPIIKEVSLKFNPASQIEEGKIDAKMAAKVATTDWAKDQESQVALQAGTRMKAINTTAKEAVLRAKASVKTPVMAMIRHFVGKQLERQPDQADVYYPIALRLSQVQDVNELHSIVVDLKKLIIENTKDENDKAFFEGLQLATKAIDGKVQSFQVVQTKPYGFNFFKKMEFRNFKLTVNERSFSAGIDFAGIIETEEFNTFVAKVSEALLAIQERQAEQLQIIEDTARGYAEMVKEWLNG